MSLDNQTILPSLSTGLRQMENIPYNEALHMHQNNTNWWTVYSCFDLPDFENSARWISNKSGLSLDDVMDALEGLTIIGFLTKTNGEYAVNPQKKFVTFDYAKKTNEEVIDLHSLVSQQILNELSPNRNFAFHHRCLAANKQILNELYADIEKAFEKAFEKAQQNKSKNDSVYKLTFTAVDVLKKKLF